MEMVNRWKCLLRDCHRKAERLIDNRGFCNDHPEKGDKEIGYFANGKWYTPMGKVKLDGAD